METVAMTVSLSMDGTLSQGQHCTTDIRLLLPLEGGYKVIVKLLVFFWKRGNPRITMAAAELCSETVGDEELYHSPRKRKDAASPKTPYYLRNFLAILNHVLQSVHNWSLFSEQELSLLRSFSDLQGKI